MERNENAKIDVSIDGVRFAQPSQDNVDEAFLVHLIGKSTGFSLPSEYSALSIGPAKNQRGDDKHSPAPIPQSRLSLPFSPGKWRKGHCIRVRTGSLSRSRGACGSSFWPITQVQRRPTRIF